MPKALITGLNSQDGSYLADFLLKKGYQVVGTVRGKNPTWPYGFNPEQENLEVLRMDMAFSENIRNVIHVIDSADECYNFAAQSHVGHSFASSEETYQVTGVGACLLMDAFFEKFPDGKFYQASTSEMIGNRKSKLDGFQPESPYAVAKIMAHMNALRHLNAGRWVVSSLLYNHESERRHESFVTQKIAKAAVQAWKWRSAYFPTWDMPTLSIGNLYSVRDWGYAPEYVEIIWKMMQDKPSAGEVIGTGISISVEEYLRQSFMLLGLGWKQYVVSDSDLIRPQEVNYLQADPELANKLLGRPLTTVYGLIPLLIEHQCVLQGVNPTIVAENK